MSTDDPLCCGRSARLTTGAEIYPRQPHLHGRHFYICDACKGYCGTHRGSTRSLGTPAGPALRFERQHLHAHVIDPLWMEAELCGAYEDKPPRVVHQIRKRARQRVYEFLADRLGISEQDCHVGMFDMTRCAAAAEALAGVDYPQIREWARRRDAVERRPSAPTPRDSIAAI
ncbi:hypothetical protein DA075_09990 [Methylobacterium currus]|uniref:Uncharacterized protein n=1 Tax=Methylobacterium currus TaxID=2051553 RepID=A0A2R4WI25_9HYPH|nr:zinc-finger-containing protein [Methylobacterium currus]AWB21202.1 hypothetical protein DA075_09990 [Methylobacterium currus]